jgi:DNA-binding IclR family transcriptional regulator
LDKVERVVLVTELLIFSQVPCGVTEISRRLNIDKSSICRILTGLEKMQWVVQLPDGKYTINDRLLELSVKILSSLDIRKISLPFLIELNNKSNETTALVVRSGFHDICIEEIESRYSVRHVITLGKPFPLWSGWATGKVILANLDIKERDEMYKTVCETGFPDLTPDQIKNIENLRAEMNEVKNSGYAITVSRHPPEAASVAAPIFDNSNRVIGGIQITGPLARFNKELAKNFSTDVIQAAKLISRRMGATIG